MISNIKNFLTSQACPKSLCSCQAWGLWRRMWWKRVWASWIKISGIHFVALWEWALGTFIGAPGRRPPEPQGEPPWFLGFVIFFGDTWNFVYTVQSLKTKVCCTHLEFCKHCWVTLSQSWSQNVLPFRKRTRTMPPPPETNLGGKPTWKQQWFISMFVQCEASSNNGQN